MPSPLFWKVALMLTLSNIVMSFAWYGHLKYLHGWRIVPVIFISWGLALFEYSLAVPANRIGSAEFTGFQLKILQEVVTLTVFIGFARFVLGETPRWNHLAAFLCLAAAAWFAFGFKSR
ncbi:MAG TPA: DMT family protein [Candidatus Methylacidiphilales bacterium]